MPRAVRLRDVCLRRLAVRRGMPEPDAAALASFGAGVSLRAALMAWEETHRAATGEPQPAGLVPASARGRTLARTALAAAVVLAGLVLFPGRAG